MKKIIMFLMASVLLLGATSCTSCNQEKQKMETVVEQTIKSDRAYMCENHGCVYVWYETTITLNDFLDAEGCDGTVLGVSNVFQSETEDAEGYETIVTIFTHTADAMKVTETPGHWIEDFALDTADITLTYRQAYERMQRSNYKKPHSRFCVLRKEVGPVPCNPQYIFGNQQGQIYVDAKTGAVTDNNPAFYRK